MNKEEQDLSFDLPKNLEEKIEGYDWEKNTIGCIADTFKLKDSSDSVLYLKTDIKETGRSLKNEQKLLEWVFDKLPVPKVIHYSKLKNREFLLLSEIKGRVSFDALSDVEKTLNITILAEGLRRIHSIDISECPIDNRPEKLLKIAKRRLEEGLVESNEFDERWKNMSPSELWQYLQEENPSEVDLVFTHGDYCLPNILVHEGKLSGFIDWGYGGINDRYFDLAAVVWSIGYNFGKEWVPLFLEKYGLDEVNWEKVEYFQKLNEFL